MRAVEVTSDADPNQEWMPIQANSMMHAAIQYIGACAGRSGGPPVPAMDTMISVRVDGRVLRVKAARAWGWANAKADADARLRARKETKVSTGEEK